jgi:hypothetical protein
MKIFIATLLAMLSFTANVEAANIYKNGSLAHKMYEHIEQVLPVGVTPVFILATDKLLFAKQIDKQKMVKAGVSLESISQSLSHVNQSVSHHAKAYTIIDYKIDGNQKTFSICPIIFSDLKYAQNKGTLFHEGIHCKTGEKSQTVEYRKAISPSFFATKDFTAAQFSSLYSEAMAAALQVAYAVNVNRVDGLDMVLKEAELKTVKGNHNFGVKTAQHLLKLCGKKGACPTDTMAMLKKLTSDKTTMSVIVADMVDRNSFEKANGIYIADAK